MPNLNEVEPARRLRPARIAGDTPGFAPPARIGYHCAMFSPQQPRRSLASLVLAMALLLPGCGGAPTEGAAGDGPLSLYERGNRAAASGDGAAARAAFEAAAEGGDVRAQRRLYAMYRNGDGIEADAGRAVFWLKRIAEGGDAAAQIVLATRYEDGDGVARDEALAAAWYRRAALQGERRAQLLLATLYETGRGVVRDEAEAARWYRAAAEASDPLAQVSLGALYEDGRGVARDGAWAAHWYGLAAAAGNPAGQLRLGRLYADGNGVRRDPVAAYMWLSLAARSANAPAAELAKASRRNLAATMRADEIALARERVRAWRPAPG